MTFYTGMDLDCTPPDDSLCADVEDQPPYPDGYTIYHYYPCKLAYDWMYGKASFLRHGG